MVDRAGLCTIPELTDVLSTICAEYGDVVFQLDQQ